MGKKGYLSFEQKYRAQKGVMKIALAALTMFKAYDDYQRAVVELERLKVVDRLLAQNLRQTIQGRVPHEYPCIPNIAH